MALARTLSIAALLSGAYACDFGDPWGSEGAGPSDADAGTSGDGTADAGAGAEVDVQAAPETLAFEGTSTAELEIETEAAWEALPSEDWLAAEPAEGSGDATLEVTVERGELEPDTYEASLALETENSAISIPVLMRFPDIRGEVRDEDDQLLTQTVDAATETDAVPGEILVRLNSDMIALAARGSADAALGEAELASAAARLGELVGARDARLLSAAVPLAEIRVPPGATDRAMAALEADGRTHYAEPNIRMHIAAVDDPLYSVQWHYPPIRYEEALAQASGSYDATVAVIDGDFYPDHPDLSSNLSGGWDFVEDTDDILIENEACRGHGTHVAGTVAAVTHNEEGVAGVAPDARVLPLSVANRPERDAERDEECGISGSAVIRAVLYAAGAEDPEAGQLEAPAHALNLSLGSDQSSAAFGDALEYARDAGVISVAASGNTGDSVQFPARHDAVMAVSALDQHLEVTDYSSTGPEIWLAAPGGDVSQALQDYDGDGSPPPAGVLSTGFAYDSIHDALIYETASGEGDHAYVLLNGTSMAAPHVAGVAALMRAENPYLDHDRAADLLAESARDLGSEDREEIGHGLVDAEAATQAAAESVLIPPEALTVRLYQGEILVAETDVQADRSWVLEAVSAGTYQLVAGDFEEGADEPQTAIAAAEVEVDYEGDLEISLRLSEL